MVVDVTLRGVLTRRGMTVSLRGCNLFYMHNFGVDAFFFVALARRAHKVLKDVKIGRRRIDVVVRLLMRLQARVFIRVTL